jgi:hypothetical protein
MIFYPFYHVYKDDLGSKMVFGFRRNFADLSSVFLSALVGGGDTEA